MNRRSFTTMLSCLPFLGWLSFELEAEPICASWLEGEAEWTRDELEARISAAIDRTEFQPPDGPDSQAEYILIPSRDGLYWVGVDTAH